MKQREEETKEKKANGEFYINCNRSLGNKIGSGL